MQEEVEILCVWDRDGGFWCGYIENSICCSQGGKEGREDETKL